MTPLVYYCVLICVIRVNLRLVLIFFTAGSGLNFAVFCKVSMPKGVKMESGTGTSITTEGLVDSFRADKLNVYVYESRSKMGIAAAARVAEELRRLIEEQGRAVG